LTYDRHLGLKNYLGSLKSHLQQSLNIGVAELQNKRNALVTELDNHLEEALNQLYMAQKEKERVLKDKYQEVDCYLKEISNASKTLQLKVKAESKAKFVQNYSQTVADAEETIEIWAPEPDLNSEWATLNCPTFAFSIVGCRSAMQSMRANCLSLDVKEKFHEQRLLPDMSESLVRKTVALSPIKPNIELKIKDTEAKQAESVQGEEDSGELEEDHKDVIILELMKSYRELETLYQWARKGVPLPKGTRPLSFRKLKEKVEQQVQLPHGDDEAPPGHAAASSPGSVPSVRRRGGKGSVPGLYRNHSIVSAEELAKQNKELASRIERLEKTIELDSRRVQIFSNRSSQDRTPVRGISPQTYTLEHSSAISYRPGLEVQGEGENTGVSSRASHERVSISTLMSDKPER
jgi:hypothetical protein